MEGFDRRRIALTLAAGVALFAAGTAGFMAILGESWHAALYRSIVSASLTGLDSTPRGVGAQALTVALVLAGLAIFGYLAAQVVDMIARGVLSGAWREKRRWKMIDDLDNHIIVCGYGRVGRRVGEEFRMNGIDYVVLDYGEAALQYARDNGDLWVDGNGVEDADLERAGIDRARGLVVSSDNDADNLYITLSAKTRRPDLIVVARASSDAAGRKLQLAGADRVVTPYTSAGRMMANLMIKPQVTAFVNVLTSSRSPEFSIDEIAVNPGCAAAGRTIDDVEQDDHGATVIAIRKLDGVFRNRPAPSTVLEDGDIIVAVGTAAELRALEDLFVTSGHRAG